MELIPGLPDDVGLECLIRVPYKHISSVASVCRSWKVEIELSEFWWHRKAAGFSRSVVVLAQARVDPTRTPGIMKCLATPVYRLTVCELDTCSWSEMPPVPGYSGGLPMFCQVAGVGLNLVVMGGWNPVTWEVSNAVFIYNFVLGRWRRGADMPGGSRSFFACASDCDRTVFVAGGHDDEKNSLRSALAYDVAKDEWSRLPDMAGERDECKGLFHGDKFHVIGGYHTEMQGRFERSAETFDVATWQWDQVQEDFLETATCPSTCVNSQDGRQYMCRGDGDVAVLQNSTWQPVAELPAEVHNTSYVTAWQGKMLVIGSPRFGEPHSAYALDLKSHTWKKVEAPEEYSGHVQSGCCLEI
uniref:F-box domain-containing protein n=1 Tax=Davidia involucrata TaxID=16924 RepID=A0A5B7BT57_DAVIN